MVSLILFLASFGPLCPRVMASPSGLLASLFRCGVVGNSLWGISWYVDVVFCGRVEPWCLSFSFLPRLALCPQVSTVPVR